MRNKIYRGFLYVLPAVLFFSYYPVISISNAEAMNYELSLPLIWLVLFDLYALYLLIREKKLGGILAKWKWLILPFYLTLSAIWSPNRVRGILTVGILWLIYFAVYAIFSLKANFGKEEFRTRFWKFFFGSALLISCWCILQCVLDLIGISREGTLMCAGCTYQMFGFPHPNGFAIEPQFMGNLMLAPVITVEWLFIKDNNNIPRGRVARARRCGARALILGRNLRKPLGILLFVFSIALFLTFSRGAIYAAGVGMIFMSGYVLVTKKEIWKKVVMVWAIFAGAFLFTLNLQGVMAQVSRTNDTYGDGVAKVLNHLSLGVIEIRGEKLEPEAVETQALPSEETEESMFDGYVVESTETRVKLTDVAIRSWSKNPSRILFGVGLGGAGMAMYADGLMDSPKEIVQNEYASLLLETGLVGIVLVVMTLWMIIKVVKKTANAGMIFALLVSYGVTLCFFSGLPNALHIYLLPAVFLMLNVKAESGRN